MAIFLNAVALIFVGASIFSFLNTVAIHINSEGYQRGRVGKRTWISMWITSALVISGALFAIAGVSQ